MTHSDIDILTREGGCPQPPILRRVRTRALPLSPRGEGGCPQPPILSPCGEGGCPQPPLRIVDETVKTIELPLRKHPSHNSVRERGFRSTILFVTVCTNGRAPILANIQMQCKILTAWANAANWIVGRYVIMPDHIHFFCAPSKYPAPDFHKWMKFWKRLSTQMMSDLSGGRLSSAAADSDRHISPVATSGGRLSSAAAGRVSSCAAKLWQDGCWDTQMRTGAQYEEKWQYIRNNPVRKGLVENADDWPYQGVMNELVWHD